MNSRSQRRLVQLTQIFLLSLIYVPAALGQEAPAPQLTAPPPIKAVPRNERLQLEQAKDAKTRIRLTIEMASAHLSGAEKYTGQPNFDAASGEVGAYHALIEDALTYLASMKRDSNKTRDLYKRLELALRADGPRLTSMRRTTPLEFAVWIKQVEDFARDGRTEALNSFYGNTVVREQKSDADKRNEKPKDASTPPKVQQP